MSRRIVFVDTETTSLRPDRRAWEIALIVRDPGKGDVEHSWFVDTQSLDLGNADVASLRIGRFHERHPQANGEVLDPWSDQVSFEDDVLDKVERLTRGAHLVGAVPSFDTDVLGARMQAHGICPSWHYQLIDVRNLAVGFLAGHAAAARAEIDQSAPLVQPPPWRSDDLSRALGIEPDESARHTALGDARWARDLYDAVMRPA